MLGFLMHGFVTLEILVGGVYVGVSRLITGDDDAFRIRKVTDSRILE